MTHRRDVLRAAAAAPFGLFALAGEKAEAVSAASPPPYTLSINIEIMSLPLSEAFLIEGVKP